MKSNNPDGRPNVLVDPVRITITIERTDLLWVDAIAENETQPNKIVTRADIARRSISLFINAWGGTNT